MADRGSIASNFGCEPYFASGLLLPNRLRCLSLDITERQTLAVLDSTAGNPAPSLRMDAWGVWSCYIPLVAGDNSISVDVKQAVNASPRPSLVIKANPDVGLSEDLTSTAASSTDWTTITIAMTATAEGVVQVELHNNLDSQIGAYPCYWDNLNTVP